MYGGIVFAAAGTVHWFWGWVYLATVVVCFGTWLFRCQDNPRIIRERLNRGNNLQPEAHLVQPFWDKVSREAASSLCISNRQHGHPCWMHYRNQAAARRSPILIRIRSHHGHIISACKSADRRCPMLIAR